MDHLYEVEGQVNPRCSKSHIRYSFYVENHYDSIKVHFEYFPKDLENRTVSKELILQSLQKYGYSTKDKEDGIQSWEDFLPLKNHITISFDDPEGFRGATHRHDHNLLLTLNEHQSSPGIESRKNIPGMWNITLSIHALVTENCQYKLCVWGVND